MKTKQELVWLATGYFIADKAVCDYMLNKYKNKTEEWKGK